MYHNVGVDNDCKFQYCALIFYSALGLLLSRLMAVISSRVWGRDGRKLDLDGLRAYLCRFCGTENFGNTPAFVVMIRRADALGDLLCLQAIW